MPLNNLNNISMAPDYETICGISEEELVTTLRPDIELLAQVVAEDLSAKGRADLTLKMPKGIFFLPHSLLYGVNLQVEKEVPTDISHTGGHTNSYHNLLYYKTNKPTWV